MPYKDPDAARWSKRRSDRKMYAENPAKSLAKSKQWREANPERHAANYRKWAAQNAEHRADYMRLWRNANPEVRWLHAAVLRCVKLNMPPPFTRPEEEVLLETKALYQVAAILTESTGIKYDVDHIIPLSAGGLHDASNLRVVTATDNRKKAYLDKMLASAYRESMWGV